MPKKSKDPLALGELFSKKDLKKPLYSMDYVKFGKKKRKKS